MGTSFDRLGAKIDRQFDRLNAKIDQQTSELITSQFRFALMIILSQVAIMGFGVAILTYIGTTLTG